MLSKLLEIVGAAAIAIAVDAHVAIAFVIVHCKRAAVHGYLFVSWRRGGSGAHRDRKEGGPGAFCQVEVANAVDYVRGSESGLLYVGKIIPGVFIQFHYTNFNKGKIFVRPCLW